MPRKNFELNKPNCWAFCLSGLVMTALALGMARPSFCATYDVGPEQALQSLGAVPWTSLQPGDSVHIHWRPQSYQEKLLLGCRGTANQPIQIIGIPGPNGELPVIDGQNAVTSSQFVFPYAGTQDRGTIVVTLDTHHPYGFKPGYLLIQGLDVRNACPPNVFTDCQGLPRSYLGDAAAIFVERGEHIVVRGCNITGSANGFFVASGDDEATESRDILLDGCYVYGNGIVGSDRQHNIYTEADGMVFQYNHLGRPLAGALGNNLKDRSAGTVIRDNWIEGGAHMLDLVDAEDSAAITCQDPAYHQTFVYGNIFLNQTGDGMCLVHYGGDSGETSIYRKGTLYFYHNTVVTQCDQPSRWRTILLNLDTSDEAADVRNNILCNVSATPGATPSEYTLLGTAGVCNFGVNWAPSAWLATPSGQTATTTVTGTENFLSGGADPGFVNLAASDVHLTANSPCLGVGGALAAAVVGHYDAATEYQAPQSGTARQSVGSGSDLGALEGETGGVSTPPFTPPSLYSIQGRVTSLGSGAGWINISAGGVSTKTGPDGSYVLSGLSGGTYAVTASGSYFTFTAPQTVTVGPSALGVNFAATTFVTGLSVSPGTVSGGGTVTGTVTLGSAAPAGGLYMPLSVSNAALSLGRPYVFVPSGATSASFSVSAASVSAAATVTLSAMCNGQWTTSNALTVNPSAPFTPPSLYSIQGRVTSLGSGAGWINVSAGGVSTKTALDGTYTLSGLSGGTYAVTASGSYFTFTAPQTVTVGPSALGVNFAATTFVTGLSVSPGTVSGGGTVTGTVTLGSAAPAGGLYMPLFVSSAAATLGRPYVFVPSGATSASFSVSAAGVSAATTVTLSTICNGQWTYASPLMITP